MKRISMLIVLCLIVLSVTSCDARYDSTYGVVRSFLDEYGGGGNIYTSLAHEGDDGYITSEMCKVMFTRADCLPDDYSLLLLSRLDSVFELGVFLCSSGDEQLTIRDICLERLELLESMARGEGQVMIKNNLVIYFFTENTEAVMSALNSVL